MFVVYHNVERGLGGSALKSHAWWLYLPYFANDFLPWTPLLIAAGVATLRYGWWRTDPMARFGFVWFTAVVGVLSCASFKRADYLLPAYPGAALLLACVVVRLAERWQAMSGRLRILRVGLGFMIVAVVVGWAVRVEHGLPAEEPFRDYRRFAARRCGPTLRIPSRSCSSRRRRTPWRSMSAGRYVSSYNGRNCRCGSRRTRRPSSSCRRRAPMSGRTICMACACAKC